MFAFQKMFVSALALATVASCAQQQALQGVGAPLLLPDGHSSEWLVSGAVCADPTCWTEDTVTAGVHTYYRGSRLVSDVHDMRPVTAPAAGYALANMVVPAAIGTGGSVGAGLVVSRGIEMAGSYQALGSAASGQAIGKGLATSGQAIGQGTAAGDAAIGRGLAAAKPPTAIATAAGGTATSSSVSSALTGDPTYNIKPFTSVTVYNGGNP